MRQFEFDSKKQRYYVQDSKRRRYGYLKKCETCGKEFFVRDSEKMTFCGGECYGNWLIGRFVGEKHPRWNSQDRECLNCGKEFKVKLSRVKKGYGKYCGQVCSARHTSNSGRYEKGHFPSTRGKGKGYIDGKGYRIIQVYDYDTGRTRHRIKEHRYIMEQLIGRKLLPSEVVHHINENKADNRPENLMLFKNDRAHQKYHYIMEGIKIGEIIFDGRSH